MAVGLPHLLNKDEDLSLEPQIPCKKKDKVVGHFAAKTVGPERGACVGQLSSQTEHPEDSS